MAATRLIPLHNNKGMGMAKTLGARTEYVKNPFKTENGDLVTSYACDKDTTAEETLLPCTPNCHGAHSVSNFKQYNQMLSA